jgi:hypothetical protein
MLNLTAWIDRVCRQSILIRWTSPTALEPIEDMVDPLFKSNL